MVVIFLIVICFLNPLFCVVKIIFALHFFPRITYITFSLYLVCSVLVNTAFFFPECNLGKELHIYVIFFLNK